MRAYIADDAYAKRRDKRVETSVAKIFSVKKTSKNGDNSKYQDAPKENSWAEKRNPIDLCGYEKKRLFHV